MDYETLYLGTKGTPSRKLRVDWPEQKGRTGLIWYFLVDSTTLALLHKAFRSKNHKELLERKIFDFFADSPNDHVDGKSISFSWEGESFKGTISYRGKDSEGYIYEAEIYED